MEARPAQATPTGSPTALGAPPALCHPQVSTTRPVFIQDGSGHHVVVNSAFLRAYNITKDTPDPQGLVGPLRL